MKASLFVHVLAFLCASSFRLHAAATIAWTNPLGGNWSNTNNWNPKRLPNEFDTVSIDLPGNYDVSVDTAASVGQLQFAPATGSQTLTIPDNGGLTVNDASQLGSSARLILMGTLSGDGDLELSAATNLWIRGRMLGSGRTTLKSTAALSIQSGADHDLVSRTLLSEGTIVWLGGRIRCGQGSVIDNQATWATDIGGDSIINLDYGGRAEFRNRGLFRALSATTTIAVPGASSGRFAASPNAVLQFTTHHAFLNPEFAGPGIVRLHNGPFFIEGNLTADNLEWISGSLGGDFTLLGRLDWLGGALPNVNVLTVAAGATLNIRGPADHDLPSHTLINKGTVVHSGGRIRGGSGTRIVNDGDWRDETDAAFNHDYAGPVSEFQNRGRWIKAASPGTTPFLGGFLFNNSGTVSVRTGVLSLEGGSSNVGIFETEADTAVHFASSYDGLPGTRLLGSGAFRFRAGIIRLDGVYSSKGLFLEGAWLGGNLSIDGVLTWVSGRLHSASRTTITTNGVLVIATANDHDMPNNSLANQGTIVWKAGRLRGGQDSLLQNSGLFQVEAEGVSLMNSDFGGDCILLNNGTLDLRSGRLDLPIQVEGQGVFNANTNAAIQFLGLGYFDSGTSFTGPGVNRIGSGFHRLNGSISADNLELVSSTCYGDAQISGRIDWLSGGLTGNGTFRFLPGSTLNIRSQADHDFPERTLINEGTVVHSGGRIRGGAKSILINSGVWREQGDNVFNLDHGGNSAIFDNRGQFIRENPGATSFNPGFAFVNSGAAQIEGGTLTLAGNGSATGRFRAAAGATVNFATSYECLAGCLLEGDGTYRFTAGSIQLSDLSTAATLELAGAILHGNATVQGVLNWTSGQLGAGGVTTITPTGRLNITSGADHDLPNHTLVNRGSMVWTGGRIRMGLNSRMENRGSLEVDLGTDSVVNNDYGGTSEFANWGGLSLRSGNLTIAVTGRSSGAFSVAANSALTFAASHVFLDGTRCEGLGNVRMQGAFYEFNGTVQSENLVLVNGTYAGTWQLQGVAYWQAGVFEILSSLTVAKGSTLRVLTGSDHDLGGASLINDGTILWTDGRIRNGLGSVIENRGLFRVRFEGDRAINNDYGGPSLVLNPGRVVVETGNLSLAIPGQTSGSYEIAENQSLTLLSDHELLDGARFSGPGTTLLVAANTTVAGTISFDNLRLTGGFLSGEGVLVGSIQWGGSRLDGPGTFTIPSGSTLSINSPADHDLPARRLVNRGTITHSGGRIRMGSSSLILNEGLWSEQIDSSINNEYGGAASTFQNKGTFRKPASNDATTVQAGVIFLNEGEVLVESSSLNVLELYSQSRGVTRLTAGKISSPQWIRVEGGVLEGTGLVQGSLRVGGILAPGRPTGLLTISGALFQTASGKLRSSWAGDSASGNFGRVEVNGEATLRGGLEVMFAGSFIPRVADSFTVLSSAAIRSPIAAFQYPSQIATLLLQQTATQLIVNVQSVSGPGLRILAITPTSPSSATVTWTSQAGLKYQLQARDQLTEGVWLDVPGQITAVGTETSKVDGSLAGIGVRFYRVVTIP